MVKPPYRRTPRFASITRNAPYVRVVNRELPFLAEITSLYRLDQGMVLTRDGDGIQVDLIRRDEYQNWNWEAPPLVPSLQKIREVVVGAAEPNDTRVQHVNPLTLSFEN